MVSTVNAILARQKRDREIRCSISTNPTGEHYFFDIELTEEQAEFPGWQQDYEIDTLVGAKQSYSLPEYARQTDPFSKRHRIV